MFSFSVLFRSKNQRFVGKHFHAITQNDVAKGNINHELGLTSASLFTSITTEYAHKTLANNIRYNDHDHYQGMKWTKIMRPNMMSKTSSGLLNNNHAPEENRMHVSMVVVSL